MSAGSSPPIDYKTYLASREWAERREAVRRRSRNKCERCLTAEMQAVHHKTYANVGHEPLSDLQAICNPCHGFLSAKTDIDPLTDGWRVYLAGPITNNPWRDSLLLGGESWSRNGPPNSICGGDKWPIVQQELVGGFDFCGPWFEDLFGGHGCGRTSSPSTHGCYFSRAPGHHEHDNCFGDLGRKRVAQACRLAIDASDIVFAWLPKGAAAFGTVFELGIAAAEGKLIVAAEEGEPTDINDIYPEAEDSEAFGTKGDYWLSLEFAQRLGYHRTPLDAWTHFLEVWPWFRLAKIALDIPQQRIAGGVR